MFAIFDFSEAVVSLLLNDIRGEYVDYSQEPPVVTAREWTLAELNYDNVGIALLTLFTVQTRDNWPEYVVTISVNFK